MKEFASPSTRADTGQVAIDELVSREFGIPVLPQRAIVSFKACGAFNQSSGSAGPRSGMIDPGYTNRIGQDVIGIGLGGPAALKQVCICIHSTASVAASGLIFREGSHDIVGLCSQRYLLRRIEAEFVQAPEGGIEAFSGFGGLTELS